MIAEHRARGVEFYQDNISLTPRVRLFFANIGT